MAIMPGRKVTYKTPYKEERGIVKSVQSKKYTFVVYHCNNNWEDYENYTAQRTRTVDLVEGW